MTSAFTKHKIYSKGIFGAPEIGQNGTRTYRAGVWIMEYNIEKATCGFTRGNLRLIMRSRRNNQKVIAQTQTRNWTNLRTTARPKKKHNTSEKICNPITSSISLECACDYSNASLIHLIRGGAERRCKLACQHLQSRRPS